MIKLRNLFKPLIEDIKSSWHYYSSMPWPIAIKTWLVPKERKPLNAKHPKLARYTSYGIMLFILVSLVMELFGVHLWH